MTHAHYVQVRKYGHIYLEGVSSTLCANLWALGTDGQHINTGTGPLTEERRRHWTRFWQSLFV